MLLDGAEALHRDIYRDGLVQFRYENPALLEVGLAADRARGVELRRAGTVGVAPPDLGRLTGDIAGSCHGRRMVPYLPTRATAWS